MFFGINYYSFYDLPRDLLWDIRSIGVDDRIIDSIKIVLIIRLKSSKEIP